MRRLKPIADPKLAFEKTLDALIGLLLAGNAHLKLGRGVAQMITSEPEISHVAPTFWTLTIYAHLDITQLIAFKLFDRRPEAATVERLLALAEKDPWILGNATATQVEAIIRTARYQIAGPLRFAM